MNTDLKYMPILRLRLWEKILLKKFYFGKHIYPCVEIIKEKDTPVEDRPKKKKKAPEKKEKSFEEMHIPIIWQIKSEKVFVDFPVHMKAEKGVQEDVVRFIKSVIEDRSQRTYYMLKLKPIANKVIPVISTYSQISAEMNSIKLQEKDLRPHFGILAFRTFPITFNNDMSQIETIAQSQDFLILDLGNYVADPRDEDIIPLIDRLRHFNKCHVVIARSAMDHDVKYVELEPGERVYEADNRLLKTYKKLFGHSFGDYAGIKKDKVNDGIGKSPGFIMYNPVDNDYYGFRGSVNEKGKSNQELEDFENIILPAVMKCPIIEKMKEPYLNINNRGWQMLERLFKRIDPKSKSPAKFKLISMEHYLHCMRTKIEAGDFD